MALMSLRGISCRISCWLTAALALAAIPSSALGEDYIRRLQTEAVTAGTSPLGHWGYNASKYTQWSTHSNRLIPVYTYGTRGYGPGIDLLSYCGRNSVYRSEAALERLYGYLPTNTATPDADYCDQTNVFDLQMAAAARGKKHIFLVIYDGMDWQTTYATAIFNAKRTPYTVGRGSGTHFQEYEAAGSSQFGYMVTSPHNEGTMVDVDKQQVTDVGGVIRGGYHPKRGGANPWTPAPDDRYLLCLPDDDPAKHAFTDSSSSAVSMTAGIKTFNGAVNVDPLGRPVETIAHRLQEKGWAVGVVTSVPISHATPAAAYAHNVSRDDYQDLTRDLLGLPSIYHPSPLPGMDVVIGCGYGVTLIADTAQGKNYVPGNKYLTEEDRLAADAASGGKYVSAIRTPGMSGKELLAKAAAKAVSKKQRLFGYFGAGPSGKYAGGNLPFQTADGDFQPAPGRNLEYPAIRYTEADLNENPTLAEMTAAAISVVEKNPRGFWLMVEAGDVDWANHDNNLDCSIGAVNSGDAAVRTITDWIEKHSDWKESLMIVTADHGHYLVLDKPELLAGPPESTEKVEK
jgi:alkaline phosphatase